MALQEDDDQTGDVISVNGEPTGTDEVNTGAEDRGDVVTDPELTTESPKPVVKDEPKEEPEPDTKPQHIPKSRFDEVNNRKNELAAELAEAQRVIESLRAPAQKETPAPAAFDEDAKEQEYIDAMLDGNADLAKQIRREINANLREKVTQQVEARNEQRQVVTSLQQASAQAVADYPYLDTEEGAEALELIIAARDAKVARGMNIAEALRSAVASIAPKFAPASDAPPTRELTEGKARTDTRTANAMARGAADSNLQPPSMQVGAGNRATGSRVDVDGMSDEQFENLTTAEKKRLRGDM